ncbi:MAG: hypothetical protein LBN38_02270, partial [Verrucomicrobiota bacterium]|nr:hypothetical protein [Verrucomicrobiota bacterium]
MTRHCFFLAALILAGSVFGVCAQVPDPTRVASPLGDVLRAQMTELRSLTLAGLVAADGDSGIALIQSEDGKTDVVRPGATLALQASGIPLRINVLGVSEKGVEIEAPALEETWMLPVSFTRSRRLGSTQALSEDVLAYVEFNRVPLGLALRLLADQSRQNYVATEAAAKVPVSLFLRDVTPEEVVEELCKSYGLWYRVGDGGHTPTTRILTMAEFQSNLASQQTGELSETFTLLYPNVTEIAAIIQGIYADRVYLSLGDEDILEDDLNDLSRRFERFNMINNSSGSSLLGNFNLQNNRGYGQSRRNGGIYSRNRDGTWDSVRDQAAERRLEEATLRDLQVEDADRIQQAMEAGNDGATNLVEILQDLQRRPASVYVTVSRRNNMLVVRTGDPRVMEDIRSLVRQLDVPTPMVLLELKILELNLTDQLNTVFDYTATGDFRVNGDDTAWGAVFPAASSQEKAMSFQLISEHFTARVQLLQERGDAKLIATPTLLTANNEVSQLFIGKEVPIIRNVTSQTIVTENNI